MGDEDFARDVASRFLDELPCLLSKLKEDGFRQDLDAVWKQAHKIKGSAANVGGEALRDAALEAERSGKEGDLTGAINLDYPSRKSGSPVDLSTAGILWLIRSDALVICRLDGEDVLDHQDASFSSH